MTILEGLLTQRYVPDRDRVFVLDEEWRPCRHCEVDYQPCGVLAHPRICTVCLRRILDELGIHTVLRGRWDWRVRDPDGRLKSEGGGWNAYTTVGQNYILDTAFRGTAQTSTFYLAPINNAATVAAGDTMASHTGWTEPTTYSETVRQTWTVIAAAGGLLTNAAAAAVFTANANMTLRGSFLTTSNVKGGTTGTLVSTFLDTADFTVNNLDTFTLTHRVQLQAVA